MFASSKRAALGVAVLSAGASVPAGAGAAAASPAPTVRACVTRGLTPAEAARGEQSVVHCAATRAEARTAALGGDVTAMSGAVTAQAGFITAGFLYRNDNLDDAPLEVLGADCGVQLRALQPPWRDSISGYRLAYCSVIKLFTGDQLDGNSGVFPSRPGDGYGLTGSPFNNRVRSVAFKAS
jgi:hypothetical protein